MPTETNIRKLLSNKVGIALVTVIAVRKRKAASRPCIATATFGQARNAWLWSKSDFAACFVSYRYLDLCFVLARLKSTKQYFDFVEIHQTIKAYWEMLVDEKVQLCPADIADSHYVHSWQFLELAQELAIRDQLVHVGRTVNICLEWVLHFRMKAFWRCRWGRQALMSLAYSSPDCGGSSALCCFFAFGVWSSTVGVRRSCGRFWGCCCVAILSSLLGPAPPMLDCSLMPESPPDQSQPCSIVAKDNPRDRVPRSTFLKVRS